MAYHLWDGFDDYDAAHELWPIVTGTVQYSSAYSRFPAPAGCVGQGARFLPGGPSWKQWNMASNQPTMIFCFPIFLPNLGGAGNNRIMQFSDSNTVQCSLTTASNGQLGLIQSFNGSLIASSAVGALTAGVQHWLAMLVTINNTTGAFQLFVDGVQVINASGLNNRSSANNFMNQFVIGDFSNTFNGMQVDDFHAHDITGSKPNAILSDSRIYTKLPTGQGFSTQFTPNGAGANWQCVDEQIPDDDVTYVSSNTPGQNRRLHGCNCGNRGSSPWSCEAFPSSPG
jgi:hypothetical protein